MKLADWFRDPDVLTCQKLYLGRVLDWVARQPQIFALEVYNEQGWSMAPFGDKHLSVFGYPWEDDEIHWTQEIVRAIKQRLPDMPVTLSHPGFGITGLDPLRWTGQVPVDFYSAHFYAGMCGENAATDFAAATGAGAAIIAAGLPNFPGEWGVLASAAPPDIRRLAHRDALWLTLLAGSPGFMQWTYEFPEEYRWPARIFAALPKSFSPERPALAVDIGEPYRLFQTDSRYPLFTPGKLFPAFPFSRQKQGDENLRSMFAAYRRSLDLGVPIAFCMHDAARVGATGRPSTGEHRLKACATGAMSLDEFAALDASRLPRPIRAVGGYQLACLADAKAKVWLAYLRSRKVQAFGRQYLGVRAESPLRIELNLPPCCYHAYLIDLDSNALRSRHVNSPTAIDVDSRATHDYVLLISAKNPRITRIARIASGPAPRD